MAELYERTEERDKALELVNQGDSHAFGTDGGADNVSTVLNVSSQPGAAAAALDGSSLDPMLAALGRPPSPTMSNGSDNGEGGRSRSRLSSGTPAADTGKGKKRKQGTWAKRTTAMSDRIADDQRRQQIFDNAWARMTEVDEFIDALPPPEAWTGEQAIPETLLTDWLEQAAVIIDIYRTTRALFPSDGVSSHSDSLGPG